MPEPALFQSGDSAPQNLSVWRIIFDENEWSIKALQEALNLLGAEFNWQEYGTATAQDAADMGRLALASFHPTVDLCGTIIAFAGDIGSLPADSLYCDGTAYNQTDWPDLFEVIGTLWGIGGAGTFRVPDLRGRTVIGTGTGSGLTPHALGDMLGEETHTLTVTETPSHTHIDAGHTHGYTSAAPNATTIGPGVPEPTAVPLPSLTSAGNASLSSVGGDGAHNNMQPSAALHYAIVAVHG